MSNESTVLMSNRYEKKKKFFKQFKNGNRKNNKVHSSTVGLKGTTEALEGYMFATPGEIDRMR